jgi:hypothetical protein
LSFGERVGYGFYTFVNVFPRWEQLAKSANPDYEAMTASKVISKVAMTETSYEWRDYLEIVMKYYLV